MKALLNEHLSVLRIANIQSPQREYEEFLQAIYEIHLNNFSQDRLLNEGFLDNVKKTFKNATDQSKKYLQYSFNQFKKNDEKPSEFVKDIGNIFQGSGVKKPSDLKSILKLARIQSLSNKKINEADEKAKEISSINDLEKLENGQKFIWKGKPDRKFPSSNFKGLPDGLIPGEEYIQAYDDINNEWVVSNTKEMSRIENVEDYNGSGFIQKLGDFFRKHKWLTLGMVAPVLASATVGGNAEPIGQLVKAITGSDVNIDNASVVQSGSNPDSMEDEDGDGLTKAGGGDDVKVTKGKVDLGVDSPDSTDSTNIQQFKQDAKKLLPDESFDFVKAGLKFDTGEHDADQTTKDAVKTNLTKSTLKQVEKVIAEKGVTENITIDQTIKGHISSNPNKSDGSNQSNVANDGSDLAKGRASTMEEITKASNEQVAKIVKDKLGIDVTFNTKVISDSDVDGQVQHDAVDQSADQSSTTEVKVDTDGGKKILTIKNWQPVVAVTGKGGSDMGQRIDIPGGGKETETGREKGVEREKPINTSKAKNPDIQRVADRIKNNNNIKTRIGNVNNEIELETLLLALVGTVNPTFQVSSGGSLINRGLTSASNLIKEADIPTDIQNIIKIINQDSTLLNLLNNVNNEKEWTELLVRIIVPLLPPDFRQNKKAIKSAFFRARNKWMKIFIEWEKQNKNKSDKEKQDSTPIEDPKTVQQSKSYSPWTTNTTGGTANIMYTLKEIKRLQKLAGVKK
jgi:hypothetical protein